MLPTETRFYQNTVAILGFPRTEFIAQKLADMLYNAVNEKEFDTEGIFSQGCAQAVGFLQGVSYATGITYVHYKLNTTDDTLPMFWFNLLLEEAKLEAVEYRIRNELEIV